MNLRKSLVATALCLMAAPAFAQPPTQAEMEADRTAAFAAADADGNGALTRDEFTAFEAAMQEKRADRFFAALDADSDGNLTSEELAAARPPRQGRGFGPH